MPVNKITILPRILNTRTPYKTQKIGHLAIAHIGPSSGQTEQDVQQHSLARLAPLEEHLLLEGSDHVTHDLSVTASTHSGYFGELVRQRVSHSV